MLSTIDCDQEGEYFINNNEFSLSPSMNGSTLHLFSKYHKNRCNFRACDIKIDKKNIDGNYLKIDIDQNDENHRLLYDIITFIETSVITIKILESKKSGDTLIFTGTGANALCFELTDRVKEYLLGLPDDEVTVSFIWKFNIVQKMSYFSMFNEMTTTVGLYITDYEKDKEIIQDDFKICIKI